MDLVVIALVAIGCLAAGFLAHKYLPNTAVGKEAGVIEKDWSTWFHNEWEKAKAEEARLAAEAAAAEPALKADLATGVADAEALVKGVVSQAESLATDGVAATIEKDIAATLQSLIAKLADTSAEDAAITAANATAAAAVADAQAQAKALVDAANAAKAQKAALLATHKAAVAAIK